MNTTSWKRKLLATLGTLVLAGASSAARAADDMGGMKMDGGKQAAKEPAKESTQGTMKGTAKKGAEKIEVAVTDKGFVPDKLEVKKGQPVEIVFTRTTDQTCIKSVVLDTGGAKIQKTLPLNRPVTIKTKFMKAGDLQYACNMHMFSGTVTVQ